MFVLLFVISFVTYKFKSAEDLTNQLEKDILKLKVLLYFLLIGLVALIGGSNFAVVHAEILAKMLNVPSINYRINYYCNWNKPP